MIASASDLLNPKALIRHLEIDAAYRTTVDPELPGRITMRAAAASCDGAEAAYAAPASADDDAIWLVVPVANHRAPTRHWGLMAEGFRAHDAVPQESETASGAQMEAEALFRRELRRERRQLVGRWILLGPVALIVAALSYRWIVGPIVRGADSNGAAGAIDTAVRLTLSIYASLYLWAAAAALAHLMWEWGVAGYWCRKEGQLPRPSTGGGSRAIFEALVPRRWHGPRAGPVWHGATRQGLLYRRTVTRRATGAASEQ